MEDDEVFCRRTLTSQFKGIEKTYAKRYPILTLYMLQNVSLFIF